MSRQIWLALLLSGCSCGKSAGNPQVDNGPVGPNHTERVPVPVPVDKGPQTDDARFHLHPEEGTLTIDKCEGKVGAEITCIVKVTPASGLHLATDYPIKMTLETAAGVKLAKAELTAGGRDKAQGDAKTLSEQLLEFPVKATADKAGTYDIKGLFKLGVCDKDSCHPKKQPITITVTAT